ncbi:MAG: DUF6785 family protein [Phycisphaerae bacterium]|jgi:hypothetical protein
MTFRAVLLGFLGALLISALAYLNDSYIRGIFLVSNQLPVVVFGTLIVSMLTINPLLRRLCPRWGLNTSELAVVTALVLVGCSIPAAMVGELPKTAALPAQFNRTRPGWQKSQVLSYVPPSMLLADGQYDAEAVEGYMGGLGTPGKPIGVDQVPWKKWQPTLLVWMPLIFLTGLAAICLSLVVHRQWSSHERLRYPVADFASTLIDQEKGFAFGRVFRTKLFWIGMLGVLTIHIVNGINVWSDNRLLTIPLTFDFPAVVQKFPRLKDIPGATRFSTLILYPTVIAFSFFLASDVAFSLGISQVVQVALLFVLSQTGVTVASSLEKGGISAWINLGGALAMCVVLAYTGRRYYLQVLRAALTGRASDEMESSAIWACRILLLSMAGLVGILVSLGVAWPLAILGVMLTMLLFVVMARLNAESGVFFYKFIWFPGTALMGLLGPVVLGPTAFIVMGMMATVLLYSASEGLMPFMVNGLRLCDKAQVQPRKIVFPAVGTLAVGLAVALVVVLWSNYNYGAPLIKDFGKEVRGVFNEAEKTVTTLTISGDLQRAVESGPIERFSDIRPNDTLLWAGGTAFLVALGLYALRMRYTWWLLHPVLLLSVGVWTVEKLAQSFFIGWLIKRAIMKFGGGRTYRDVVPLMIGIVAGDLMGGLVFMVVGWVYYAMTGITPKVYNILR